MTVADPRRLLPAIAWVLIGCSTTASATGKAAAGPTSAIKEDDAEAPVYDARADAEHPPVAVAGATDATACVVRPSERTFIGMHASQSLDDFELTARTAATALKTSESALCRLSAAQDKDGTLRAALSGGVVEITALRFTRKDLSTATLDVRTAPADGGKASALETRWAVYEKRVAGSWQVVSAVRQKPKRR